MLTVTQTLRHTIAALRTGQDQLRNALVRTAFFPFIRQQGLLK